MSCEICKRGNCIRSFHSIQAQEEYDERQEMSEDVDDLRCEIQELKAEVKEELKTLDRYDLIKLDYSYSGVEIVTEGDYLLREDVEKLIKKL